MARMRIECFEGVGVAMLRDVVIVSWLAPSTVERVSWVFDMAEKARATSPKGVLVLQLIAQSSTPPDDEARKLARARFTSVGSALRLMVTVPLGDELWTIVVRTIMRGIFVVTGNSKSLRVATRAEAIDVLFEAASETTPTRQEIEAAIDELHTVLGAETHAWSR